MKHRIVFLAAIVAVGVHAQWVPQVTGTTVEQRDIKFINANVGQTWRLETTNGGATWTPRVLPFVYSCDSGNIRYRKTTAEIQKSTNAGASWVNIRQISSSAYTVSEPTCLDSNTVSFAYSYPTFTGNTAAAFLQAREKTTDGGAHWTTTQLKPATATPVVTRYLTDMNPTYGTSTSLGSGPGTYTITVSKSTNNGVSWSHSTFTVNTRLRPNISALSAVGNTIFVAGIGFDRDYVGEGYKTTDGGVSWFSMPLALYEVHDMFFVNANVGWAVGNGNSRIYKTTDGGQTWGTQDAGANLSPNSVFFIDENTGWIAGSNGVILKTTNGGGSVTPVALGLPVTRHITTAGSFPYNLTRPTRIQAKVFDGRGALLLNLLDETMPAGNHVLDLSGLQLPPGAHFLDFKVGAKHETVRLPAR